MECHGVPEFVIVGGRVCVDNGEVRVVQGHGRFIETPCHAPFLYDKDLANKLIEEAKIENNLEKNQMEDKVSKLSLVEEVIIPTLPDSEVSSPSCKGPRMEGQRNLQDSTFSISGELIGVSVYCILNTI